MVISRSNDKTGNMLGLFDVVQRTSRGAIITGEKKTEKLLLELKVQFDGCSDPVKLRVEISHTS